MKLLLQCQQVGHQRLYTLELGRCRPKCPFEGHERWALPLEADLISRCQICREWDGPAALPPPTALRVRGGLVRRRSVAMSRRSTVRAVTTIGIDMGKNTLQFTSGARALHVAGIERPSCPTNCPVRSRLPSPRCLTFPNCTVLILPAFPWATHRRSDGHRAPR